MEEKNICTSVQAERYLLNQMDVGEEANYQKHLHRCKTCQKYIASIRTMAGMIGEEEVLNVSVLISHPKSKTKVWLYRWISAAACVMMAVSISFYWWRQSSYEQKGERMSIEYLHKNAGEYWTYSDSTVWLPPLKPSPIEIKIEQPWIYKWKIYEYDEE